MSLGRKERRVSIKNQLQSWGTVPSATAPGISTSRLDYIVGGPDAINCRLYWTLVDYVMLLSFVLH